MVAVEASIGDWSEKRGVAGGEKCGGFRLGFDGGGEGFGLHFGDITG